MRFKIEIDCDNAQFADGELMLELSNTLVSVAIQIGKFECGLDHPLTIRDINGNRIGSATFDIEEPGDRPGSEVLGECSGHRDDGRGRCIDCGAFLPSAEGSYWDPPR